MINLLNQHLGDILRKRRLDWRTCYSSVVPQPPDGRTVKCECSDAGVLAELELRMRDAGGDGQVRYLRLPPEDAQPAPDLMAVSSVADVRKTAAHASELLTQVIYGDTVELLKDAGEWYLVRLDDGYLGWIRSWHVKPITREQARARREAATHWICVNHAEVLAGPENQALPVTDLVIGTNLELRDCDRRGWRGVRLPDGKEGFLKSRAVEKIPVRKRIYREKLAATGLRFLGIPYIWGGTTPKGFDCSGLMQRIYKLNGLPIPRDADQQSGFGRDKPVGQPDALATGDMMFFGSSINKITHVAMVLSDGLFLHAYGQVRVGSVDPASSLYESKLMKDWRISKDPLSK